MLVTTPFAGSIIIIDQDTVPGFKSSTVFRSAHQPRSITTLGGSTAHSYHVPLQLSFCLSCPSTSTDCCSISKFSTQIMVLNAVTARSRVRGRSPTRQFRTTNASVIDSGSMNDNGNHDDSSVEPMDEDDQRAIMESLHAEAIAQSRFFQHLFGYGIGGVAMIISFCFPLLCPDECYHERLCWLHATFSSAVHAWTVHPFILHLTELPQWKGVVGLAFQIVPWLIWLFGTTFSHDADHFHLGLMIGNLVTYSGSFLIHWDMQSTNMALRELDDAQYRHKAL
jgi:hypothetical protein